MRTPHETTEAIARGALDFAHIHMIADEGITLEDKDREGFEMMTHILMSYLAHRAIYLAETSDQKTIPYVFMKMMDVLAPEKEEA